MTRGNGGERATAGARAADPRTADARTTGARTADARTADHEAIARLADELLPSLIAKLGATGLGEIEVREGERRIRLRGHRGAGRPRPADKPGERPGRAQPGHEGHGHAPGAIEPRRAGHDHDHDRASAEDDDGGAHRAIATSPAVGVFQPRQGVGAGTKVRQGDKVGFVEMLGIPQEVVSPVDGIVGASLVEPGQAVEYGQELVVIELASAGTSQPGSPQAGTPQGAA